MIQNLLQAFVTFLHHYVTGVTTQQTLIDALPSNQLLILARFLTDL